MSLGPPFLLVVKELTKPQYYIYHDHNELRQIFTAIVERRYSEGWYQAEPAYEAKLLKERDIESLHKYNRRQDIIKLALAGNSLAAKRLVMGDSDIRYETFTRI